ncbi:hypothetical protein L3Y34_003644 [Caenorhabditis briggsae]|uniref:RRM domain-containing protein n=1 Tax=Caenorhabditis briggsae TaxID=6238 RepID=A0AAE9A9Y3_CAEBR|nr:hypothetical protein L3Y34_003644 [Caenorhabditis briggsae]
MAGRQKRKRKRRPSVEETPAKRARREEEGETSKPSKKPKTPRTPRTPRIPKTPNSSRNIPRTPRTPKRTPKTPKEPEETPKKAKRTRKRKKKDAETPEASNPTKSAKILRDTSKRPKKDSKISEKASKTPKKTSKKGNSKKKAPKKKPGLPRTKSRKPSRTRKSIGKQKRKKLTKIGELRVKNRTKKRRMKIGLARRRLELRSRRPRINDIRQKVVRVIERSLVEAPKIPLICHLFQDRDSLGTPRSLLRQVLRTLKISNFVKRTHLLKNNHMKSLSKFTTLFVIEEDEPNGPLYVKYWPIYNRDLATVYVDRLPEACNEAQLLRLAQCYGTVAELSVGRKTTRWVRPLFHPRKRQPGHPPAKTWHKWIPKKKPLINVGGRPKPFGFVRFVDQESAEKMIKEFIVNDPSVIHQRMEEKRKQELEEQIQERPHQDPEDEIQIPDILFPEEIENLVPIVPREFPRPRPYVDLQMIKMFREIRYLKRRRRRRPFPMYLRLYKLQRRFDELCRREYICLRRAGIIDPRARIRRREKMQIRAGFPSESAITRNSGRAPPPCSPKNEDDEPQKTPFPYYINKKKRLTKKEKQKIKLEKAEKKRKRELKKNRKFKFRKRKPKGTFYLDRWVDGRIIKKRVRRRKKQSRKSPKYIPGGQVRRFFQDIQVLSLKKYKELKEEYLELVRIEKERAREEAEAPPPAPEPAPDPERLEELMEEDVPEVLEEPEPAGLDPEWEDPDMDDNELHDPFFHV